MSTQSWFAEAKLGVFVHWGISAVRGIAPPRAYEPGRISHQEYMEQLRGFTAARYNPDTWAELFAHAGARYAVMTAKDRDGIALWDTTSTKRSVATATAARTDLVRPFAQSMRRHGLRVGFYFSPSDWSDYPLTTSRPSHPSIPVRESEQVDPPHDRGLSANVAARRQARELVENFRPDLLWLNSSPTDGQGRSWVTELPNTFTALNAQTIITEQLEDHGDHDTPTVATSIVPADGAWQLCYPLDTTNASQWTDTHQLALNELIGVFADTIAAGGNLLLKTSPHEDGTIPPGHFMQLTALGNWIRRNHDAFHTTTPSLPYGHYDGPSTLSQDRRTLFLICTRTPPGPITVRGLHNTVRRAYVLSTGAALSYQVTNGLPAWGIPHVIRIEPPAAPNIIVLELKGELDPSQPSA
ncbi:alpha-L-fucosidase [Streptomyces formicae]|uniref:alpha-L-fucosidase n=1 Tax=Streptomyces formicae TaxID=1616117 RepID=A0ABY3WGX1_9ACTN|nr:alpha-L-fucosidase [Streptomyces formicae]UNM11837.1 alpha-L-fucosidase [Streptomyces formicae]